MKLNLTLKRLMAAVAAVAAVCPSAAVADDGFFSTEQPDRRLTIGVRLGLNTSNCTRNDKEYKVTLWNRDNWGNGVHIGAVADIALRDYIAIQPGFFLNIRNNSYARVYYTKWQEDWDSSPYVDVGDVRHLNFTVPVLCSVRFNITPSLRWSVEAGPYLDLRIGSSDENQWDGWYPEPDAVLNAPAYPERHHAVFGLKAGTGLTLRGRWYAGVHYMAGMTNVWSNGAGGRQKVWDFSLGYWF